MIKRRHIFLVTVISVLIHCATLIFVAVVFYPIMNDLRDVIPSVKHITRPETFMEIIKNSVADENITGIIDDRIQFVTHSLKEEVLNLQRQMVLDVTTSKITLKEEVSSIRKQIVQDTTRSEQNLKEVFKQLLEIRTLLERKSLAFVQ